MRPRRSRNDRPATIRWQAYAVAALLFAAIIFGGGGAEGPLNNGLLQGCAAILLALLFASQIRGSWPLPDSAKGPAWLLLGLFVIVLVQLLPLPPSWWQGLSGRELARSALALVGSEDHWRPLSLDPEATRRLGASLLLPAAILFGLLGATRREAVLTIRAVVAAAAASAAIGALQLALGSRSWLSYYEGPTAGAASGVFANPNHQATLFVAAILCLGFLIRANRSNDHRSGWPTAASPNLYAWLALPLFIVMTIATGSRAGLVLLPVAMIGALLIAIGRRSPRIWLGAAAAALVVAAATVLLSPAGNQLAFGQSFFFRDDARYDFLPDVIYTLQQYWPVGSGLGTFVPVFAPNENLDIAGAGYVNHAHNDLLEWLIETGALGAIWLTAAAATILWRFATVSLRGDRLRGTRYAAIVAGGCILLVFALQSVVDYPLRTDALSAIAAAAAALLFAPLPDVPASAPAIAKRRWPMIVAVIAGILLAAQVVRLYAAQAAVRSGNGELARNISPSHGEALALAAEQQLRSRNPAAATRLARSAIEHAPLTTSAVRVLAMAAADSPAAGQSWRVASAMGWRDDATQLWALQQALANGQFDVAAIRADALLRTNRTTRPQNWSVIRTAALEPRFRAALVERMMLDPDWRGRLLVLPPDPSDAEVAGTYEIVRALAETPKPPTRSEAKSTLAALIDRNQHRRAWQLFERLFLPAGGGARLPKIDFDSRALETSSEATPFDWTLRRSDDLLVSFEQGDGVVRLVVGSSGNSAARAAQRLVALPPGSYRLAFQMRGDTDAPEALPISVYCVGSDQPLARSPVAPLNGTGLEPREFAFAVPGECPMLLLAVEAKPSDGPRRAEFERLSLSRLQPVGEAR